jgi:hypothetical protein
MAAIDTGIDEFLRQTLVAVISTVDKSGRRLSGSTGKMVRPTCSQIEAL